MTRIGLALALVGSLVASRARAQTPSADPLFADDGTCRTSGEQHVHPGYFATLGASRHDLEIETALATNGDLQGGTLRAAARLHRFDRYWSLIGGLATGVAYRRSLDTTIGSTPIVELGLSARSNCDQYLIRSTVLYAPATGAVGTPHEWQTTLSAVPTMGPWSGTTFMPRSDLGALLFSFDTSMRTNDGDAFVLLRFRFRAGAAQVGSQFGTLVGFVGALAIDIAFALRRIEHVKLNLALGGRIELDLSSFWPANAVAPLALVVPLRWSPDRAISIELWAGFVGFTVNTSADLPPNGAAGGLSVINSIDL
jgi:hypothetical protein